MMGTMNGIPSRKKVKNMICRLPWKMIKVGMEPINQEKTRIILCQNRESTQFGTVWRGNLKQWNRSNMATQPYFDQQTWELNQPKLFDQCTCGNCTIDRMVMDLKRGTKRSKYHCSFSVHPPNIIVTRTLRVNGLSSGRVEYSSLARLIRVAK